MSNHHGTPPQVTTHSQKPAFALYPSRSAARRCSASSLQTLVGWVAQSRSRAALPLARPALAWAALPLAWPALAQVALPLWLGLLSSTKMSSLPCNDSGSFFSSASRSGKASCSRVFCQSNVLGSLSPTSRHRSSKENMPAERPSVAKSLLVARSWVARC